MYGMYRPAIVAQTAGKVKLVLTGVRAHIVYVAEDPCPLLRAPTRNIRTGSRSNGRS